jgi:chromosome segregation ATPase
MKISDIVAKLTGLESRLNAAAVAELQELKASVTGQLTQLTADLETARASIESLGAEKAKLTNDLSAATDSSKNLHTALQSACAALKLDVAAEADAPALIARLQGAVTETLAKLNVAPEQIPAGKPAAQAATPPASDLKGRARMIAAMKIEGVK